MKILCLPMKKRSTVFVGRLLKEFPFHISTIQGMQGDPMRQSLWVFEGMK